MPPMNESDYRGPARRALESPPRWTTNSVPHLAEAGRSGSPPDKHSGDRQRGATGCSGFAAGDFTDDYSSPASLTSCACPTCCAV